MFDITKHTDEELVRLHPISSHRVKAEIEIRLYKGLSKTEHKRYSGCADYTRKNFGGSRNKAANRQRLFRMGAIADPLWERIEAGTLFLDKARELLRDAVDNTEGLSPEVALARLLSGKKTKKKQKYTNSHNRTFWNDLRTQIVTYICGRVENIEELDLTRLVQGLEADLKTVCGDFQHRVNIEVQRQKGLVKSVTSHQLREAFGILHLDLPTKNKPINMKLIGKRKRELARLYHPDMNQGDESMRALYEAVLEAFNTIDQRNRGK